MESINSRKLTASVVLVIASVALLIGLTFAWFTDSVTNKGNKIQAGTLGVTATVAEVEQGKTDFTIAGVNGGSPFGFSDDAKNLEDEGVHVISEDNWEPGQSNAKLLTVKNGGSLATKVKLQFDVQDGGLQDALWFDFIRVENGGATGQFTERPMSQLATIADSLEFKLGAGESVQFILVYGMDESAGNEYQGKSFTADATVLATQDTVEKDGFGNDRYDANATLPVTSVADLKNALTQGGSVSLGSDMTVDPEFPANVDPKGAYAQMSVSSDTTLDLSGKTISLDSSAASEELPTTSILIDVLSGTTTLDGDGVVSAEAGYNNSYAMQVNGGSLVINSGSYYGAMSAVQVAKGSLVINGGFFDLAPTIKSAAPSFSKYLINCIDSAYNNGTAKVEITGGTFVNFDPSKSPEAGSPSFVADGYKVVSGIQSNGEVWYTVVKE